MNTHKNMSEDIQTGAGLTLTKGITGISAAFGGIFASSMPAIEAWLRVASLMVGIAVGVATLVSLVRKKK